MNRRIGMNIAIVVGLLAAAAACSSQGKSATTPPVTPTSPHTSPSVRPTPPPISTDPSANAKTEAEALVRSYLSMLDTLYDDSTVSINDIYSVAVAPESTNEALAIGRFRAASDHQSGRLKLAGLSDVTATLTPGSTAKYPSVTATACVDVRGTSATGPDHKSIVEPGRPAYLIEHLTIVNIKYPSSDGWRVSAAPNTQATSCAG